MNEGLAWIKNEPGRWLALIPKKLSHTFDHESFPIGYLGEANPPEWPEERKRLGRAVLTTTHRFLLGFAALGAVAWPTLQKKWLALFTQLGLVLLVLGFAFAAYDLDRHPIWPLAIVLIVLGALPLPGAPRRTGVIGYLVFAVASVAITHAIFFGEDRYHLVITPALCVLAAGALRRPDERTADA
jgi:hypothetical protein